MLLDRNNLFIVVWVLQFGAIALFTPLNVRILGVGRFGDVAAATALAQGVYALSGILLQYCIQRRYDKEGPESARLLILFSVILAAGATAVVYVTGPLWSSALGFGPFDGAVRWAVLWGGLMAMTGGGVALLKCQDQIRPFVAVSFLQTIGAQILAVAFVLGLHRTAPTFVLGLLAGQAAATLVAIGAARPSDANRRDVAADNGARTHDGPLIFGVVATLVLGVVDRLVIEAKLGSVAVGRYQVAGNFGLLAIAVLGGLSLVWLPRSLEVNNVWAKAAFLTNTRNSLYLTLVPVIVGLCLGGQVLLDVAVPRSYGTHGLLIVLTFLALSAMPYVGAITNSCILISTGQTRTLVWAVVVAAAISIDLNLVLISIWHIAGAAAATLLSWVVLAAMIRWRADRELRLERLRWSTILELFGATAIVLLWSQAPTTTPWIILRIVNIAASAAWLVLDDRTVLADRLPSEWRTYLPRRRSGPLRRLRPGANGTSGEIPPTVDESEAAAQGRLRRGLPAGLLDSGFSSLSSFLMGLIATHYLLPKELGEYAIFYSAFALAGVIPATMIFTPIEVGALEQALNQRLSVIRRSLPLGGLIGFVSGLVVCAAVIPIVTQVSLTVRVEFGLTVVVLSCVSPAQDHLRRMFHQSGRSWIATRISIIQVITVAVTIVVARLVSVPLPLVPFGALVLGNVVSGIAGWRLARPEPVDSRHVVRRTADIIRGGGWLTVGTAYGFAAGLATVTILADRSGAAAAGQTEAARVLSQPVTVVAIGVLAVFGPEMMTAGQRGQTRRVNKMMVGFLGVVVAATLVWLVAVGVPWSWSPISRVFSIAYEIGGLTALTIVQQALAYGSLPYRAVIIANGGSRNIGKLDLFANTVVVVAVYVMAPDLGAFSIVWAFLGIDLLLFGVRARMASNAVRAAETALGLAGAVTTSLDT